MVENKENKLDETGKTVFDNVYNSPNPRQYCMRMAELDYMIPEQAQPSFEKLFNDYQEAHTYATQEKPLRVLDLGSSYGINAALLRFQMPLKQLFQRYEPPDATLEPLTTEKLLERDQKDFHKAENPHLHFTGFDVSDLALRYSQQSGLLQAGLSINLEADGIELDKTQRAAIQGIDCVISSGVIGYITTKTLRKLLDAFQPKQPWMQHCVLRMFSLDEYVKLFNDYGYVLSIAPEPVRQRRFASKEEQAQVISRLKAMGVDPAGYEEKGWLYATLITVNPL